MMRLIRFFATWSLAVAGVIPRQRVWLWLMPSGVSSMRSWALAGALYLTAAIILRQAVMIEVPLPLPVEHDHDVFHAVEPEAKPLHRITSYCACPICCGDWSDGYTASGKLAYEGRTIAADVGLWPMGTCLAIPGVGQRIVEDTGSAIVGRAIDVFIDDHARARTFGVRYLPVGECDV
jgi:3D (Asp-Asp-Asp) domain-containing protein